MKLYIEVDLMNVKDKEQLGDLIELIDIQFVEYFNNGTIERHSGWVAKELYDENTDSAPEIKQFNIFTGLEGKMLNDFTGNMTFGGDE